MKPKNFFKLALAAAALMALMAFAGCGAKDDLSKIFGKDELGDFWELKPDDSEIVAPPSGENDADGENVIIDDDVLNMDSVRALAYKRITPFEFMAKYPGTVTGENPAVYLNALPNEYVIRIEYSGDEASLAHLEDHRLDVYLDLLAEQSIDIDMFLLERGD